MIFALPMAWVLTLALLGQPAPEEAALLDQLAKLRSGLETSARLGAESRLLYFAAERAPDGARREQLHAEGLALAAKARILDPDEPSALLWWAAHRGSQASVLNPFAAVRIAREVEETLLRLLASHPDYDHGAADRALGRLYQVAPRGVSVGSMEKAGDHLGAALQRDPDFPGNALFYAQYLGAKRDCAGAHIWAIKVLQTPKLADHPLERAAWVQDARRLLADLPQRCPREERWP